MKLQEAFLQFLTAYDPTTKDGQTLHTIEAKFTITGAANNGSGLIRITAIGHGLSDDDRVHIKNMNGTVEANSTSANPNWKVKKVSSSVFDLIGSNFVNAFVASPNAYGVGALVGTVDGDKLTKERQLQCYNQARVTFLEGMKLRTKDVDELMMSAGAHNVVEAINFTAGVAPVPPDIIKFIDMTDADGNEILLLPNTKLTKVLRDERYYVQSTTRSFIFQEGQTFVHYGTFIVNAGRTIIYKGITDWTLAQLSSGTVEETIEIGDLQIVIELAVAIASGMGSGQAIAVAARLLGVK